VYTCPYLHDERVSDGTETGKKRGKNGGKKVENKTKTKTKRWKGSRRARGTNFISLTFE
jgi:hypothetical protein